MAVVRRRKGHSKVKATHKQIVLRSHHSKPYRKRQVLFLLIAIILLGSMLIKIGAWYGRSQVDTLQTIQTQPQVKNSVSVIRSSYGYSLAYDANIFRVSGTELNKGVARTVLQNDIHLGSSLTSVTLRPKTGTVPRAQAASQLTIQINTSEGALTTAIDRHESGTSTGEVALTLFPQTSTNDYDVSILDSKADTLNGVPVQKTTYQYTPKFNGGNSYSIVWTGVTQGRAFAVKLQGLVGSSSVPAAFSPIFESLTIESNQAVKGVFTDLFAPRVAADASQLNPKYLSDALTPAVVKIYHIVCGSLSAYGRQITDESCSGFTGSGFLATSNGYIATNGHVVTYSAQDQLVDIITSDPSILIAFLRNIGLSDSQILSVSRDPAALASIIAEIYDIPDEDLKFSNGNQLTLVALGSEVPEFGLLSRGSQLNKYKQDSDNFRVAKLIDSDYSSKDMWTTLADPEEGFSSSDVALLKINVSKAPTIGISKIHTTQSEKIYIMGFPGDADNTLTDNSSLSVSVTDGVISSVRRAAGGSGKLYQSDADASHGNSGGPAVDASGGVIGLLTYRAADGSPGNAAKSYIRDIADFTDLAKANDVVIDSTSTTQSTWQTGLDLFSNSHYKAALTKFSQVSEDYPAHRLVGEYIENSQIAIAAGKDVPLVSLPGIIFGAIMSLGSFITATILIVRHRVRHHLYKVYQPEMPQGVPVQGFNITQPVPTDPKK